MTPAWNRARGEWRRLLASHGRGTMVIAVLMVVAVAALAVVSAVARAILEMAVRYGSIALVVYLAFDLVLHFSHGPSAFDGAGEPFQGPSARAAILLVVAVVGAIALNWVGPWPLDAFYPAASAAP
jgi:hypothetical protein